MLSKSIELNQQLADYLLGVGGIETPELAAIRKLADGHPQEVMQTTFEQGQLIYFLAKLINARQALELGVFFGYSALATALALPQDGKLIACDVSDENVKQSFPHWEAAKVRDKIDLRIMPGLDLLRELGEDASNKGSFDFAFVDADKLNYINYYELILPLMRPGGLLLFDNTLWKGEVVNSESTDEMTQHIRQLNQKIADDPRVTSCLLPLADGMTLISPAA